MKIFRTKTWQHEITGVDGNTTLFGVNIFDMNGKAHNSRIVLVL